MLGSGDSLSQEAENMLTLHCCVHDDMMISVAAAGDIILGHLCYKNCFDCG